MTNIIQPWAFGNLKRRHYRLLYADPPWLSKSGMSRNPLNHYPCIRLADIKALPVAELAHPDGARLLMWVTMPFLEKGFETAKAWGFRYSTARVWVKLWPSEDCMFITPASLARGTGYEVIGNAEMLLIFKIGRPAKLGPKKPGSVIIARRREHSRKPDMVRDEITHLFDGPRCELFARTEDSRFDVWGNQTTRFNESLAA